jgi:hypothetical protein
MSLVSIRGQKNFGTFIYESVSSGVIRMKEVLNSSIRSQFKNGIDIFNSGERVSFSKKGKYRIYAGFSVDASGSLTLRKNGSNVLTLTQAALGRSLMMIDIVEIDDLSDYIDFTTNQTVLRTFTLTITEL